MDKSFRDEILVYAKETYQTLPEYPWDTAPNYAVLRHSQNQKWYAVILDVPRFRLNLDGEGKIDILNIKLDPILVGSLRLEKGFLPAYHMNKERWISVLLDGSVPLDKIYFLLNESYILTLNPKKRKK
ncbi:MAG: MmcQ/YjbR family DNA-binding protein [Oscillospiraceae bacterium]|nr:MmcQ/YjbR family DNA-binding protein [Oscillospiraceae bacterium]